MKWVKYHRKLMFLLSNLFTVRSLSILFEKKNAHFAGFAKGLDLELKRLIIGLDKCTCKLFDT